MFWSLEIGGALEVVNGGRGKILPAAVDVPDHELIPAVSDLRAFAAWAQIPDATMGQLRYVRKHYCRIQGLGEPDAVEWLVRRLARFGDALEVDLQRHYRLDLGDLWRGRQWRRLDNLLAHLPQDTFYRQEVLNDPEMVREVLSHKDEGPKGFAISDFSATVSVLRDVVQEQRMTRATLIAVNSKNGAAPKVDSYPGPITAIEQTDIQMRKEAHDRLRQRLLPDRVE